MALLFGEEKIRSSEPARVAALPTAPVDHVRVTERFQSIEGEGLWIGRPTYLVRLAGCNLRCTYCDTKFSSWYDDEYEFVAAETLIDDALKLPASVAVSFTGGEPLFRPESELRALANVISVLDGWGYDVKIETSGTIVPPAWFPQCVYWSVAPKLHGMGKGTYLDVERLSWFVQTRNVQFKFVIGVRGGATDTTEDDFAALNMLLGMLPMLATQSIIIQPEGLCESTVEYLERYAKLVERTKASTLLMSCCDVRVLPQLHTVVWRNERRR